MLAIEKLSVSYDGSRILRNVSLNVPPGQVVCLMGRNGVGKTTTLKAIAGLVQPDAGSVKLGGTELVGLKPEHRARHGLGYVPQGRDIFPNLTVRENLRIGAIAQGKKLNGEVDRVLELFPILKEMLQRKGGVLSGGQQQQLAIGRALLTNPKVLLLDEPTEGIQPNIIDHIGDTIKKLRSDGFGCSSSQSSSRFDAPCSANPSPRTGPLTPSLSPSEGERVSAGRVRGRGGILRSIGARFAQPESNDTLGEALGKVRAEGRMGILLVEQYLDFCLEVGDSFYIMDRGSVVANGPVSELNDDLIKQHLTV
jgi:urea transport system ATP-binding protein